MTDEPTSATYRRQDEDATSLLDRRRQAALAADAADHAGYKILAVDGADLGRDESTPDIGLVIWSDPETGRIHRVALDDDGLPESVDES